MPSNGASSGTVHDRCDVRLGLLRESGERVCISQQVTPASSMVTLRTVAPPPCGKALWDWRQITHQLAAPLQGVTGNLDWSAVRCSGLFTRPAALVAFAFLTRPVGLGMGHSVDMGTVVLVPVLALACARRRGGGAARGVLTSFHGAPPARFPSVVAVEVKCASTVIIPTRNEAQAIGRVLEDVPRDLVNEVTAVVDNCSLDETSSASRRPGWAPESSPRRVAATAKLMPDRARQRQRSGRCRFFGRRLQRPACGASASACADR